MILTHKMEIKPNKTVQQLLNQYFGYSRYCYNKGLAEWNDQYNTGLKPTGRKVRDKLKSNKEEWEKSLSPIVLDTSIEDLERGFKLFFKGQNKHPKFKSKKKSTESCRFYRKNDYSIRIKGNRLFLPKFPYGIRMTEELMFNGVIKTCTITKRANKYFASFTIDTTDELFQINNNKSVGIDLGIKEFAILGYGNSNNRKFKHYKSQYRKLKPYYKQIEYYQKRMSKKKYNSNKYLAMKTKLQRLYLKVNNIQRDFLNKLSTKIVSNFKYITIENLNVRGMVKNRKLSEKISRSLFYTFRCMLEYKSNMYGNSLIIADRFFPSTQTCSHCGYVRTGSEKLTLSDREYICSDCGVISDRDENAAYNLKLYGERQVGLQP